MVIQAGEEAELDLLIEGPNPKDRLVLLARAEPLQASAGGPDPSTVQLVALDGSVYSPRLDRSSPWLFPTELVFEELPGGPYTLRIEDPRFVPWERSGLDGGSVVDARLRGRAAISLQVLARDTGQRVERYRLGLRRIDTIIMPNEHEVHPLEEPPPPDGLHGGIVPGDWTALVSAPGLATLELPLGRVEGSEVRAVTAELHAGGRIEGHVQMEGGESLDFPSAVHVRRPSPPAPPGEDPLARWQREVQEARNTVARVACHSDGRFQVESIPAGRYELLVDSGALGVHRQDELVNIDHGEAIEGLRLTIPAGAWLSGRLEAEWLDHSSRVELQLAHSRTEGSYAGRDVPQFVVPLAQGEPYALGPVAPGQWSLALHFPTERLPGSMQRGGILEPLGDVQLRPGRNLLDLDLNARAPGLVEARVRVHQGPGLGGELLMLVRSEDGGRAVTWMDGDGLASLPVPPGTWRAFVLDGELGWSLELPGPLLIAPGGRLQVVADVEIAHGDLSVADTEGRPLANAIMVVRPAESIATRVRQLARTDGNGRLRLALPVGARVLLEPDEGSGAGGAHHEGPPSSVEWTAEGPVPSQVRLALP